MPTCSRPGGSGIKACSIPARSSGSLLRAKGETVLPASQEVLFPLVAHVLSPGNSLELLSGGCLHLHRRPRIRRLFGIRDHRYGIRDRARLPGERARQTRVYEVGI